MRVAKGMQMADKSDFSDPARQIGLLCLVVFMVVACLYMWIKGDDKDKK